MLRRDGKGQTRPSRHSQKAVAPSESMSARASQHKHRSFQGRQQRTLGAIDNHSRNEEADGDHPLVSGTAEDTSA